MTSDYTYLRSYIKKIKKCFLIFVFTFSRNKVVRRVRRLNPLTNTRAMLRLNPYSAVLKREAILSAKKRQASRDELLAQKRKVSSKRCTLLCRNSHDELLLVRVYEVL